MPLVTISSPPRPSRSLKPFPDLPVRRLLDQARSHLEDSEVPEASANAEFLMAAALGVKRGELRPHAESVLVESKRLRFRKWVSRRARRHPLSYVLGTHDFMDMELRVTPAVLIPRPETELLVETVLEELSSVRGSEFTNSFIQLCPDTVGRKYRSDREGTHKAVTAYIGSPRATCLSLPVRKAGGRQAVPSPLHILDIGTGSGCVTLALARRLPQAQVIATDISREALKVASSNARRHKLQDRISFVQADLFGKMPLSRGWADIIVSNPPYVPSRRLARLEPEVLREPRLALNGGPDGLKAIRAVIRSATKFLKPGGFLALEIDHDQGSMVRALMEKNGFCEPHIRADFNGLERIALGRFYDSK